MLAAGDLPDCRWTARRLLCEIGEHGKAIRLSAHAEGRVYAAVLSLWSSTARPIEPTDHEICSAWYRLGLATMRRPGAVRVE